MGKPRPDAIDSPGRFERWLNRLGLQGCRFTPAGRGIFLAAIVFVATGLFKGINLLVLLGYALPVVLLMNARSSRHLIRLRATRLLPRFVHARMPAEFEIRLEPVAGPITGSWLEDRGPSHCLRWPLPEPNATAPVTLRGSVVLPRRGRYAWGPAEAVCSEPFGLIERRIPLAPGEEVLVLPRLGRIDREQLLRHMASGGEPDAASRSHPRRHAAARAEFHGLRPFRTGDSTRAVHWRTSARRGELMVREYEDFCGESVVLILDPGVVDAASAEKFEAAVSLAALIVAEWCQYRGERLVFALASDPAVVHSGLTGPELAQTSLEALAVSEPTNRVSDRAEEQRFEGLVSQLLTAGLPAGPLMLIAAATSPLAGRLERRLRRTVTCLSLADATPFYEPPPPHLSEGAAP